MEKLWEKIKKSVVEGASYAAGKTEEFTKLGKMKIEILNLKRKISSNFTELGGTAYEAIKADNIDKELKSDKVTALIDTIDKLENELEAKEKQYEELSKKEEAEVSENPEEEK
ncbi:hypothetical protein ACFL47_09390 [Candidatus Latescibacterota bacterium]